MNNPSHLRHCNEAVLHGVDVCSADGDGGKNPKENNPPGAAVSFCSPALRSIGGGLQPCSYEQNVCRDSGQQAHGLGGGWLKTLSSTRSSNYNTEGSRSRYHCKERRVVRRRSKSVEKEGFMHGRDRGWEEKGIQKGRNILSNQNHYIYNFLL